MLGDLLCSGPAFRALRRAMPNAHIALIGLPWAKRMREVLPGSIDEFIEFPGYPGFPERDPALEQLPSFLELMRRRRFDLAIQMHGNGVLSNSLVTAFGARRSAGYYVHGHFCPDPTTFILYPQQVPEVWRHLALLTHLGIPACGDHLECRVRKEDQSTLELLLEVHHVATPYVCLHPGTNAAWRNWAAENYAAVGDHLAGHGFSIVLTGSVAEHALGEQVISHMQASAVNLAGLTPDVGVLAALLKSASLVVCGDTGISHLACAVDCPSVVVFMRSELEGWPPLDRLRHRVVCEFGGVKHERVIAEALSLVTPAARGPQNIAVV